MFDVFVRTAAPAVVIAVRPCHHWHSSRHQYLPVISMKVSSSVIVGVMSSLTGH